MTHVEFMGAPGVGKTSLWEQLITHDECYGGVGDGALRRVFLEGTRTRYRLCYHLLPSSLQRTFENELLRYRYRQRSLDAYLNDHTEFVETMCLLAHSVEQDRSDITRWLLRDTARYELGRRTVTDGEVLCIDEGFMQRLFSIYWRDPDMQLYRYIQSVTTPSLVIHVDAPPETALARQRSRGRVTADRSWEADEPRLVQRKIRRLCLDLEATLSEETNVLHIDNIGETEPIVSEIRREIHRHV